MTYYVDYDTGNDTTGDGSQGNPWKTPNHALSVLGKGDTLRIVARAGGAVYPDYLDMWRTRGSTGESDRITIQADDPNDWPVIAPTTSNAAADIYNQNYVTFYQLEFDNSNDVTENGIILAECSHIIIDQCKIHDCYHGIERWRLVGKDYITVMQSEIHDCNGNGIIVYGNTNYTFERNEIYSCAGRGIYVTGYTAPMQEDVIIRYNSIHDCVTLCVDVRECDGLTLDENYLGTVANYSNVELSGVENFTFNKNVIEDSNSHAISIDQETRHCRYGHIERNVIRSYVGSGAIYIDDWDQDGQSTATLHINGNTMDAHGTENHGIYLRLGTVVGTPIIEMKNNIMVNSVNYGARLGAHNDCTVDNDYNCYYGNATAPIHNSTFGNGNNPESNWQTTDPLFVDTANDNYRLNPGSPCIGNGDDSIASLHGGPSDIGAREFGAPVGARLAHGKYCDGPSAVDEMFELVHMEK